MSINPEILPRVLLLNRLFCSLFVLLCSLFAANIANAANESLARAVTAFDGGHYEDASAILKDLLLSDNTDELDGAIYLMARVHLARKEGKDAVQFADRLLKRFPQSGYVQYARYAKAEAFFLLRDFSACADELVWVSQNAADERLRQKAERIIPVLREQTANDTERETLDQRMNDISTSLPAHLTEGRIALIIAYPGMENDPTAKQIQRSFRYGADYGKQPFQVTILIVGSAFEAARSARSLMQQDSLLFLIFAGDEGAAMSVALLAKEHKVPMLKLTADERSFLSFSPEVYEFLPSMEMQAMQLGIFAAEVQHNRSGMVLSSDDEKGRALADGFRRGMRNENVSVDAVEFYPTDAGSIRPDIERVFSNKQRIAAGKTPLSGVLSAEERAQFFGNAQGGEVLMSDSAPDTMKTDSIATNDAFLLVITPERLVSYASQLRSLPKNTTLYGNSSWIDTDALNKSRKVADGMFIAAPLIPTVRDSEEVLHRYETAIGGKATLWELLGLDAAEYVGSIMTNKMINRDDARHAILRTSPYFGRVVTVDFKSTHENQSARILQFKDGDLQIIR
jgi:ABC-type branched-subunit amino acid transport system substrate-binding protein